MATNYTISARYVQRYIKIHNSQSGAGDYKPFLFTFVGNLSAYAAECRTRFNAPPGCRREVLHFACRAASGCAGARYCLGEGRQTLDRRSAAATEGQPDAGGLCRPGAAARTRAFRLS